MDRLSFATLEKLGYSGYLLKDAPERVVQFGEGNFLRAFADHFIDLMNEKAGFNSKVVLVQPRGGQAGRPLYPDPSRTRKRTARGTEESNLRCLPVPGSQA